MAKSKNIKSVKDIEEEIIGLGSDNLPTFGGKEEGGIQCQQVPFECASYIQLLLSSGEKIENYLEIGSAAGGSVFLIDKYFKPKKIVLIDNNLHPKAHVRPYILRDIEHIEVIGNSHDKRVWSEVKELNILFDLIFVDGDHYYDGVRADVYDYSTFLKVGGFLVMHDTAIGDPFGCNRFYHELKKDKQFVFMGEFVAEYPPLCGVAIFKYKVNDED